MKFKNYIISLITIVTLATQITAAIAENNNLPALPSLFKTDDNSSKSAAQAATDKTTKAPLSFVQKIKNLFLRKKDAQFSPKTINKTNTTEYQTPDQNTHTVNSNDQLDDDSAYNKDQTLQDLSTEPPTLPSELPSVPQDISKTHDDNNSYQKSTPDSPDLEQTNPAVTNDNVEKKDTPGTDQTTQDRQLISNDTTTATTTASSAKTAPEVAAEAGENVNKPEHNLTSNANDLKNTNTNTIQQNLGASLPTNNLQDNTQDLHDNQLKNRDNVIEQQTLLPQNSLKEDDTLESKTNTKSLPLSQQEIFINNEAIVLLLPDDDVVLGKLTKQAKVQEMDFYTYLILFDKTKAHFYNANKRAAITKYIENYDKSFRTGPILEQYYAKNLAFDAVKHGDFLALKALLDNLEILQITNKFGNTLLHIAALHNQYPLAKLTIMRGINTKVLNQCHKTALMIAEEQQNHDLINLLREIAGR